MPDCIDVEKRFGDYKTAYEDPCYVATQDPWHKVIQCRDGHISPAGGKKLWACTRSRGTYGSRMIVSGTFPCEIRMDGSDGVNAEFDVSDAACFLSLMGAKKR